MKELNVTVNYTINEEKRFDNLFPERKQCIQELTQVIKRINKPFTMTLTSEWGTGKTYFLKAWQLQLEKEAIPFAYYNAWEFEQDVDPLIALIGNIAKTIKAELDESFFKRLSESIKRKINKNSILDFLGIAADLTGSAISAGSVTDFGSKTIIPFKDKKSQTDSDNSLLELLEELKDKIHQKGKYKDTNYPIVVMIDELDRCKPDYVITLLERIKHIFTMNGYVFVLSIDQEQLYTTVEHVFGFKKDTNNNKDLRNIYLQKFIDLNYNLAKPDLNSYIEQIVRANLQQTPTDWNSYNSIVIDYCPKRLQSQQYQTIIENFNNKFPNVPDEDNKRKLFAFQSEIINIIYRLSPINLRDFEKKFEKFLMLYNLYMPNIFLTFILLCYIFENEPSLQKIYEKENPIADREQITSFLLNKTIPIFERLIFYKDFFEIAQIYHIDFIDIQNYSINDFELLILLYYLVYSSHYFGYSFYDNEFKKKNKLSNKEKILTELEQLISFSKHIALFS